ncbi:MAG: protein kinase [Planctomycetes bacterium]|nr:protein kinase [Planctomycetota bacterium]
MSDEPTRIGGGPASGTAVPAPRPGGLFPGPGGRYEVLEELGRGGMAVVFRARDRQLDREVALKVMREGIGAEPAEQARFRREAEAGASLAHPNVVTVHDAGPGFLVMELVRGRSLADLLRERPEARFAVGLLEKSARGVQAAHARGIIHRDLKPSNIMVATSGEPKVADFGIAHFTGPLTALTQSGMLVGTPLYMAPEQVEARRDAITPRTDVYALGAILHEILTGEPPFVADTPAKVLHRILHDEPSPIRGDLGTIAQKAMDKDPARRYADAGEFADDLARWRDGHPILARPASTLYRVRKRLARQKIALAVGLLGLAALAIALSVLLPEISHSRRMARLWGDVSVILADGERYAAADELARARERLEEGLALCTGDTAEENYFRGRLLHALGRRKEAEEALSSALTNDPALGEAHFERGLCRVEEYELALERIQTAFAGRSPESGPVAPPSGDELEAMSPALAALKKAAEDDLSKQQGVSAHFRPVDADYGRAELARLRWQWDVAIPALERVLVEDPLYTRARLALVQAEMFRSNHEAAVGRADEALKRHAGSGEAYYWRGRALFLLAERDPRSAEGAGRLKRARDDLDRAIERLADPLPAFSARGDVRFRTGEVEGAIGDYTRVIDAGRLDAFARTGRGIALFSIGDYGGAEGDLTEAVRIAPGYAVAWAHRAKCRAALDNLEGALSDAVEALKRAPPDAPYRGEIESLVSILQGGK